MQSKVVQNSAWCFNQGARLLGQVRNYKFYVEIETLWMKFNR